MPLHALGKGSILHQILKQRDGSSTDSSNMPPPLSKSQRLELMRRLDESEKKRFADLLMHSDTMAAQARRTPQFKNGVPGSKLQQEEVANDHKQATSGKKRAAMLQQQDGKGKSGKNQARIRRRMRGASLKANLS